jgi:chemotaxis protein methyltransferase CheR
MTVEAADFTYISELVGDRSAIRLRPEKNYLVEARLLPLVKDLGLGSIGDLVTNLRLQGDRSLEARVVEAMTTNETSWFRDNHPFEALRKHIVPELVERNAARRTIRIWSAASSTGQELLSIAMTLDSTFPELADWRLDLFGTDLSAEVVEKARRAHYSGLEVNRGLPASLLVRYFERVGRDYVATKALRDMVRFEQMNLIGPWTVRGPVDVVFLRNVLIYFDNDVKRRILEQLVTVLAPGGYLVLGASETTLGIVDRYETATLAGSLVHRTKER